MNLLTIIILLVLLVFAINGYMRGFARTLTSLLFVFSGVLVYYSTPYVNDFLKTQTPVYSFVESKCETLVEDAIMDKLDKETQNLHSRAMCREKIRTRSSNHCRSRKNCRRSFLIITTVTRMQIWRFRPFSEYISTYLADMILNMLTYFYFF